jgi:hypothetical protein
MAYAIVHIVNSTNFTVCGTVSYMSLFCSNDDYCIGPNASWSANSRGLCLVKEISAVVQTPGGNVQATPYTSSGTSYSSFAVVQTGTTSFAVTRVVSGAEDAAPSDHVDPTEHQK